LLRREQRKPNQQKERRRQRNNYLLKNWDVVPVRMRTCFELDMIKHSQFGSRIAVAEPTCCIIWAHLCTIIFLGNEG
jgi:hypothetical protein